MQTPSGTYSCRRFCIPFWKNEPTENGQGLIVSGFLQSHLLSPQAEQQVTPDLRPQFPKQVPEGSNLQNGNSRVYNAVSAKRRVGLLSRFQRFLLSHSHMPQLLKIPKVSPSKSDLSNHSSTFWPLHSSHGVYYRGKGSETHGLKVSHPDSPVSRRLAHSGKGRGNMSQTYTVPYGSMPGPGLDCQPIKVRPNTSTGLLCRLSV